MYRKIIGQVGQESNLQLAVLELDPSHPPVFAEIREPV